MGRGAVLVACLLLLAPGLGAEPPSPFPSDIYGLSTYVGTPARPERARVAWERLRTASPEEAVRLAAALGLSGGAGALEPLEHLLRDRSAVVRRAASRALGRVGMRNEDVVRRLRETVRWRTGAERRAAMLALGRLGDGRDVETLLTLSLEKDEATALTAFQALGPLTGMKLPSVHARWSYWWRSAGSRMRTDVARLLDRVEEERKSTEAVRLRDLLARQAWVDIPTVRSRLERWLGTSDDAILLHAVVLAGELRLAELGPRIERLRDLARAEGPLTQAAETVLLDMGLRFPPEPEPKAGPEAEASPEFGGPPVAGETPPAPEAPPQEPPRASGDPPSDEKAGEEKPASGPSGAPVPEQPAPDPSAPR